MEILQIKNLSFRYPQAEKNALEEVSFAIHPGEFVVLCGASGCGKTTLLRLLKRELAPYGEKTGEIIYRGADLAEWDDRTAASEIGFVMQNPENQTVTDQVWHELAFGPESLGLPNGVIRRRVAEMASFFGIENWFRQSTNALSGGQKQILNLASVMVMQPKLLLLDEPTAQLDPIAASDFIGTLHKLNQELGLTVLLVEHRLEEVFPVADKVLMMDAGRLLFCGSPREAGAFFEKHPEHPLEAGLPAAMRIASGLKLSVESPLTVKEGRAFIQRNFKNDIKALEPKPFQMEKTVAFACNNIWFRYEKELPDILRGVSCSVYEKEMFCVLGGYGTGKTTLLGVIAGLYRAYRGTVQIDGQKIQKYRAGDLYRHNIALLPQNPQTVFLGKTVREDFLQICETMEYSPEETEMRIAEAARKLGITHLLQMHPYDLSGGEQQKAALAKMLLLQPKILLLDEPTKGIDAYSKQTLGAILKQLKAEGITIVAVTHDVEFAAAYADRCGLLFDGELVSVDTPAAFFSGNHFYTTAANRIAGEYYQNAILCEDVVRLCRMNGTKQTAERACSRE